MGVKNTDKDPLGIIRIRNTGKYNISASLNFPSFLSLKFSFQKYVTGTYRRIKLSFIFTKQMSPLPPDLRFLPAPLNCFSIRVESVTFYRTWVRSSCAPSRISCACFVLFISFIGRVELYLICRTWARSSCAPSRTSCATSSSTGTELSAISPRCSSARRYLAQLGP